MDIIDIVAAVSVIIGILLVRKISDILPLLPGCLLRWKECLTIENSVRLARERNIFAAFLARPRFPLPPLLPGAVGRNGRFRIFRIHMRRDGGVLAPADSHAQNRQKGRKRRKAFPRRHEDIPQFLLPDGADNIGRSRNLFVFRYFR